MLRGLISIMAKQFYDTVLSSTSVDIDVQSIESFVDAVRSGSSMQDSIVVFDDTIDGKVDCTLTVSVAGGDEYSGFYVDAVVTCADSVYFDRMRESVLTNAEYLPATLGIKSTSIEINSDFLEGADDIVYACEAILRVIHVASSYAESTGGFKFFN